MFSPLVFVNTDGDPNAETQKKRRRAIVASYVGRYHRNRSKPQEKRQFEKGAQRPQPTLVPAAFKGNSDPFRSTPVDIDPTTNDSISFYRDAMLPAMAAGSSPTGWTFWESTPATIKAAWAFMAEPTVTLSFIARAAMLAAIAMPSRRNPALVLSNQSMEALRKDIARPHVPMKDLYTPIIIHWSIETLAGNAEAAAIHGHSVKRIFDEQKQSGSIDFKILRYVLHMDAIASAMFLRKPLCNTREWCTAELGSDEALRSVLSVGYDREDGLEWHEVLSSAKQVLTQWHLHCSGNFEGDAVALTRLFYQVIACHALIVRSYVSVKRANGLVNHGPMLLATLFWFRAGIFHFQSGGLRFYDTVAPIYSRLLLAISQAKKADPKLEMRDRDTRLWLLYTGAQMEKMLDFMPGGHGGEWFAGRLKETTFRTGIVCWVEMEELLQRFVYVSSISPCGSSWFSRVVDADGQDV